jgi:hypothetical protein
MINEKVVDFRRGRRSRYWFGVADCSFIRRAVVVGIGRPLTPLSFAGVARRTAFRGAMYAGAAYGAAAYGAPYGYPYASPACGYYPYPPCY